MADKEITLQDKSTSLLYYEDFSSYYLYEDMEEHGWYYYPHSTDTATFYADDECGEKKVTSGFWGGGHLYRANDLLGEDPLDWTDYIVSFKVVSHTGRWNFQVRCNPATNNAYTIQCLPGNPNAEFVIDRAGVNYPTAGAWGNSRVASVVPPSTTTDIIVSCIAGNIQVWADGVRYLNYTDGSPQLAGTIGIAAYSGGWKIADIKVIKYGGECLDSLIRTISVQASEAGEGVSSVPSIAGSIPVSETGEGVSSIPSIFTTLMLSELPQQMMYFDDDLSGYSLGDDLIVVGGWSLFGTIVSPPEFSVTSESGEVAAELLGDTGLDDVVCVSGSLESYSLTDYTFSFNVFDFYNLKRSLRVVVRYNSEEGGYLFEVNFNGFTAKIGYFTGEVPTGSYHLLNYMSSIPFSRSGVYSFSVETHFDGVHLKMTQNDGDNIRDFSVVDVNNTHLSGTFGFALTGTEKPLYVNSLQVYSFLKFRGVEELLFLNSLSLSDTSFGGDTSSLSCFLSIVESGLCSDLLVLVMNLYVYDNLIGDKSTQIFLDTASDVDNTLLALHTPDVGNSWVDVDSAFHIKGNTVRGKLAMSSVYYAVNNVGSGLQVFELDWRDANVGKSSVIFRSDVDIQNCYYLTYSSGSLTLRKHPGATFLASSSVRWLSTNNRVQVYSLRNRVLVFFNGYLAIDYAVSSGEFFTNSYIGLWYGNNGTVDQDAIWGNVTVYRLGQNPSMEWMYNILESGIGSETLSILATFSISDLVSGVDTPAASIFLTVLESVLGSDLQQILVSLGVSDTNVGTTSILNILCGVNVLDSSLGLELFNLFVDLLVPETGVGSENVYIHARRRIVEVLQGSSFVSVLNSFSVSDIGSATQEFISLFCSVTVSDDHVLVVDEILFKLYKFFVGDSNLYFHTQEPRITALIPVPDVNVSVDESMTFSLGVVLEDYSYIAQDIVSLLVEFGLIDTGSFLDEVMEKAYVKVLDDLGASGAVLDVFVSLLQSDETNGLVVLDILAGIDITETGYLTDELHDIFCSLVISETGITPSEVILNIYLKSVLDSINGVDTPQIFISLFESDLVTSLDEVAYQQLVNLQDSLTTLLEAISILVNLNISDTSVVTDIVVAGYPIMIGDNSFVATELLNILAHIRAEDIVLSIEDIDIFNSALSISDTSIGTTDAVSVYVFLSLLELGVFVDVVPNFIRVMFSRDEGVAVEVISIFCELLLIDQTTGIDLINILVTLVESDSVELSDEQVGILVQITQLDEGLVEDLLEKLCFISTAYFDSKISLVHRLNSAIERSVELNSKVSKKQGKNSIL